MGAKNLGLILFFGGESNRDYFL